MCIKKIFDKNKKAGYNTFILYVKEAKMPYMKSKKIMKMRRRKMLGMIALGVAMAGLVGVSYVLLKANQDQQNAVMQSKIRGRS